MPGMKLKAKQEPWDNKLKNCPFFSEVWLAISHWEVSASSLYWKVVLTLDTLSFPSSFNPLTSTIGWSWVY